MRIAEVCPRYPPLIGGVEVHVSRLAAALARGGAQVEVLTHRRGEASPLEDPDGVVVRRFRVIAPERYAVAPGLVRALRAEGRYDIVHAHDYVPLAAASAAFASSPLVYSAHYHGRLGSGLRRAAHRLFRAPGALPFRRAARVICNSAAEADLVRADFPGAAERIEVVPLGTEILPPSPRQALGDHLIAIGRLVDYKRIDRVLRAVASFEPMVRLVVVGDGPARDGLGALAAELRIKGQVEFAGAVSDAEVARRLAAAGALVTMSTKESFGLVALDALAAGLPVVASDIPAHREVRDRFGGDRMTLVPDDATPAEIASILGRALAVGARVRPPVLPTWDSVAARMLEIYSGIVRT